MPAKAHILFIEDNEHIVLAMKALLEIKGHSVVTANSVEEALQKIEAEDFDVVISDVGLPDGTGHDVLKRSSKPLRAIAMTGYSTDREMEASKASGFERHLVKPVDIKKLEAAIQEIVGSTS